ncbi:MAG: helix-turn-helix transcriptional regulator [Eggerthellaceae bacterium]|nr:helix-turn-helix transcriptional regulator [Eggerthellaceae bacterium]
MQSPKTNISALGYALFLTVNATSIWGGVFPFLPIEFQTPEVTLSFFLAQLIALCATLVLAMALSYRHPSFLKQSLAAATSLPVTIGSFSVILAMYTEAFTMFLIIGGGALLGIGCAGFFLLWERLFASQNADTCNKLIIIGTGIAPLMYVALHLIPIAITAFLTPLVFAPLCGLSLWLGTREIDFDQSMFSDIPGEHPSVYKKVLGDSLESVLCVASLGLMSGIIRAITLADPSVGSVVNIVSMLGSLFAAMALMGLWSKTSFRFDIPRAFRFVFPLVATGFVFLPFFSRSYLLFLAAATFTIFIFATMLMMIQSAQISRDQGANPVIVYGFYAAPAYMLQGIGFLLGYHSGIFTQFGFEQLSMVAMLTIYVIGIVLWVQFKNITHSAPELKRSRTRVEFQALSPSKKPLPETFSPKKNAPSDKESTGVILDKTSKLCLTLQDRYRLSDREREVLDLLARGNKVSMIAEALFVSENTVRSHNKRIYRKLNIHKRQDLLDMLREIDEERNM